MNRFYVKALTLVGMTSVAALGAAQDWGQICVDPMNMQPRSDPYLQNGVGNVLIGATMGLAGTVTYGGATGPCFSPAATVDIRGRMSFFFGPRASNQRTSENFTDDNMPLTFGAPSDPFWTYGGTTKNGAITRFGQNDFNEFFVGFSNRYMWAVTVNDNVRARLQTEIVGDAARLRWTLTNLDTASANIGVIFGSVLGFLTNGASNPQSGGSFAAFWGSPNGFITIPNGKPPVTDRFWDRSADSQGFPDWVAFNFGQADASGMLIENTASEATNDIDINDVSEADRFWLGKDTFIMGAPASGGFPRAIVPDTTFAGGVAFAYQFPERPVAPGATIQVLHYVRSTWGLSDYRLPFGVTVDAPKTLATRATDFNGNPATSGLVPNPMPIRVYVDNVGGFGFDGKEFPLNDVRVRLTFPANSGITVVGAPAGFTNTLERSINFVDVRDLEFLDFSAVVDNTVVGNIPYTVEINAQPGNVRKVLNGVVSVAARPQLTMFPDANMITLPYDFQDTSLESIFQPFLDPTVPNGDLQFYRWDPVQQGYVIVNSASRGNGFWAIYNKSGTSPVLSQYAGNPRTPNRFLETSPLIQLKSGFNQIGNPYNFRIPINQITGVSASNNQISRTFREMVDLGYIQSFVTRWNPVTKDYELVAAEDGFLEPHQAYWINVLTQDDLTIQYPPVNTTPVADSSRRPAQMLNRWPQSDQKWRLKLTARMGDNQDTENYLAVDGNAANASKLRVGEAPMSPVQKLSMSVEQVVNGTAKRMSQAVTTSSSRQEFKLLVQAKEAGDVTVTWPNLNTIPKNVRLRVTDPATNVTRLLRQTSGYTFRMDKPGTRALNLTLETGGSDIAVIGNVVVSRAGRASNAPVTVAYTLGADATTSIRILSASGKEVYALTRGRADRAGENTVTWNLRNSANQAVAPGTYRVEIVAESASGERNRKFAVVNVIR
jgi:hypothetical protein